MQIFVHPEKRHFNKILWRNYPNEELQTFELQTVIYEIAPAAFLAIKFPRKTDN